MNLFQTWMCGLTWFQVIMIYWFFRKSAADKLFDLIFIVLQNVLTFFLFFGSSLFMAIKWSPDINMSIELFFFFKYKKKQYNINALVHFNHWIFSLLLDLFIFFLKKSALTHLSILEESFNCKISLISLVQHFIATSPKCLHTSILFQTVWLPTLCLLQCSNFTLEKVTS